MASIETAVITDAEELSPFSACYVTIAKIMQLYPCYVKNQCQFTLRLSAMTTIKAEIESNLDMYVSTLHFFIYCLPYGDNIGI